MHRSHTLAMTILGSTGSVGESALRVVDEHPTRCEVVGLVAHSNIDRLEAQMRRYAPRQVAVWDTTQAALLRQRVQDLTIDVLDGMDGVRALASDPASTHVLAAMSGVHGLQPLLDAIAADKTIGLANKESLVMAGEVVMTAMAQHPLARMIPVDSEHSAVFQCLESVRREAVSQLWITGSGGPLRTLPTDQLATASRAQVLNHPKWKMGQKITVDSATLMNKGLEFIEAHWLFGFSLDAIRIVIHPEAAIHGMIELVDGSMCSLMSTCDMRLPIQYAMSYPEHWPSTTPRMSWEQPQTWHFEAPALDRFPCLRLAMQVAAEGGTAPAVLNAANEVAVHAFLQDEIPFGGIAPVIEQVLSGAHIVPATSLDAVLEADHGARVAAHHCIQQTGQTVSAAR